jgi:hypothetical protein
VILDDFGGQIFRHRPHPCLMFPDFLFYIPAGIENRFSRHSTGKTTGKLAHLGDVPPVTFLLRCNGQKGKP